MFVKIHVISFLDLINAVKKDTIELQKPPSIIRKKREIDLGDLGLDGLGLGEDILKGLIKKITELLTDGASSLGLDKLGLDKDVIEGIIEKIINLIMDGFGGGDSSDNNDGDENVTEAAAADAGAEESQVKSDAENSKALFLRRKKREIDLGALGLDGLGLGEDVVKDLTKKITDLIDGITGLGLDKLGLGKDVVKNLIKKIIDLIDGGNNGGGGGGNGATEGPKPSQEPTEAAPASSTAYGCRPHYILCFF
uniref:Uncharacterized protein n=1 Tax=Panagrolaimus superbus TaxID=310955 RepID=A0A914Y3R8_9BILA